jgi:hypothetical protein
VSCEERWYFCRSKGETRMCVLATSRSCGAIAGACRWGQSDDLSKLHGCLSQAARYASRLTLQAHLGGLAQAPAGARPVGRRAKSNPTMGLCDLHLFHYTHNTTRNQFLDEPYHDPTVYTLPIL